MASKALIRRRWTFSTRSLLCAVAVLAVVFALIGRWTYDKVQQGIARAHFSSVGIHLATDDNFPLLFSDVERLEKTSDQQIADEDLAWLSLVPRIEVVWLEDTSISDAGLPYLRS